MGLGAWEDKPQNQELLLIAIPNTGITLFKWAVGFKMLMPPVPYNVISNRGLPIDRARCDLVEQAKKFGASHIFFLDSDVIVPADGLIRLWNRRLPVVTGIYGSKHELPGVWIEQAKSGLNRYAAVLPDVLEKYQLFHHPDIVVGAGCCLIDMKVFDRLEAPYFEWTQGRKEAGVSEDFYFFEKVRKAQIPIHVDTTVRCEHLDFSSLDWKGKRSRLEG